MSKLHFITYKEKFSGVTKDGHQMFIADIVNELNRKSFLEGYKLEADKRIAELEERLDYLLSKVGVDVSGVYLAAGNAQLDKVKSLENLKNQAAKLKEQEL